MNEAHTETIMHNKQKLEAILVQVIRIHEQLWMLSDITKLCAPPKPKYQGNMEQIAVHEEIKLMKRTYRNSATKLENALRDELKDYLKAALKLGLPMFNTIQFGGYNVQVWEMMWKVVPIKEEKS